MLIEIRDFLKGQGVCSLSELSTRFGTSPEAMRGMLSHWQRKGRVVCERPGCASSCNKGCVSCEPEQLEIYRWQGSEQQIPLCAVQ